MGIFDKKECGESEEVKKLQAEVNRLERKNMRTIEDYERIVGNLNEDHKIVLARKDAELETKIHNKTKELETQLKDLTIKEANSAQKATILETAFKNLGFDVKDMKEILNKLVDGIVSKNQIQLVKGS